MKRHLVFGAGIVGIALLSFAAAAQTTLTADDVLARMRANATAVDDFDAHLTVQTYDNGSIRLTQELRLSLLQPDKMRQEYVSPDYLAGNLTIIVGSAMWTYIAASETWYSKDLSLLSDAEQPWLAFRQLLRNVQDELANYAFTVVGMEGGAYHLRGTGESKDAVYGAIELWVDPDTFVPRRRLLYDTEGNLLVDARVLDVEEIAPSVFVARRVETYDEAGILKNTIVYDSVTINQGLDPGLFAVPGEASS
ncbi:MAG: outer membrane lipoprotein-sorting protein [Candidatus Bipolaricaulota bacterium]|nr:outer membrane lipoprotein-sorting protein [Candidatus Bipolaricaulota bacterium]